MKYWIIVSAVAFIALVGGYVALQQGAQSEVDTEPEKVPFTGVEYSIVITPDGYQPSEITIAAGDKITFSASESYGKMHWPASNIHPSHEIYPAFDPLRPIEPDTAWSFVFGKRGEWRFHDHLAPYHTGTITVE